MVNTSKLKTLILGTACTFVIGCANTPPAAPSSPAPSIKKVAGVDVAQLKGIWEGEYESSIIKRHGGVKFDLNKVAGVARGRIILTKDVTVTETKKTTASHKTIGPKYKTIQVPVTTKQEKPLSIDFIGLEDGNVKGEITPHFDPELNATVYTTYEGTLSGNRMQGTYTSRVGQTGNLFTGTWWVIRK